MADELRAVARLAGEMEAARPSDRRRGERIAADATIEFAVEKSAVIASVGATSESGGRTVRFMVEGDSLRWSCTCSGGGRSTDWCKHVVAAVVAADAR